MVKLQSLPCYCATLRQVVRAVTVLYEEVLGDSGQACRTQEDRLGEVLD